ncbi:hypothetical protein BDK51DRAFT_50799 [Blyttiomyces helicus]|uniref:Ankyrin repeat-containing domain protein n=1 Tax=Blyttiomyces helicus TaxID=388810 RepID=A0A4P9W316_9FUNG|nr:hypothetical protein BDK51DRAFT_50799 [Blyttiomyces helicus]|eukprot:RKO85218.1 hypothetical protein BDK51DRAFT_50799 [Blyttiomyces helicus]
MAYPPPCHSPTIPELARFLTLPVCDPAACFDLSTRDLEKFGLHVEKAARRERRRAQTNRLPPPPRADPAAVVCGATHDGVETVDAVRVAMEGFDVPHTDVALKIIAASPMLNTAERFPRLLTAVFEPAKEPSAKLLVAAAGYRAAEVSLAAHCDMTLRLSESAELAKASAFDLALYTSADEAAGLLVRTRLSPRPAALASWLKTKIQVLRGAQPEPAARYLTSEVLSAINPKMWSRLCGSTNFLSDHGSLLHMFLTYKWVTLSPNTLEALVSSCAPPLLNAQDASGDTLLHLAYDHRLVHLILAHLESRPRSQTRMARPPFTLPCAPPLPPRPPPFFASSNPSRITLVQVAVRAASVAELGGGDLSALLSALWYADANARATDTYGRTVFHGLPEGGTGLDIFEAWVRDAGGGELVVDVLRGLGTRSGQELAAPVLQSESACFYAPAGKRARVPRILHVKYTSTTSSTPSPTTASIPASADFFCLDETAYSGSSPANTPPIVDASSANKPDPASFADNSSLFLPPPEGRDGGNHPMDLVHADVNVQTRSTDVANGHHDFQVPSHSAESGPSVAQSPFSLSELSLPSTSF